MWFLYVDVRKASQLVATGAARFNVGMKIKFDIEMLFRGASGASEPRIWRFPDVQLHI